ncbi:nitroreductase family protein [Lentisphaera profundi]|uniref:Nitroreductase family protein n=1 Tax=Lentisphaera profundi TaxID=1658616 RepID=A0ABY7W2Q5_9BACT|nr:nitroreductase family protein [Lentisphaera profundi]WDE98563.1 nitroreductase family protein [Lentisphaera profundi]
MTASLKSTIKFYLNFVPTYLALYRQVLYDWHRFKKYSSYSMSIFFLQSNGRVKTAEQLSALVQADAHKIEKALAITNPRPGFGVAVVKRLRKNMLEYYHRFNFNSRLEIAYSTLLKYIDFNKKQQSLDEDLEQLILQIEEEITELKMLDHKAAGLIEFSKKDYHQNSKKDLENFFMGRYSIRQFSDEEVSMALLKKAVQLAAKTPSVCNRQSYHAFIFQGREKAQSVLSYQLGNRGFGEQVDSVITVTADLSCFFSATERNQAWIDGGLYAMSLMYALHSLGLGCCPLNWSVEPKRDCALKDASGISHSHSIIMMIAIGHLQDNFKVAKSKRKPMNELCTVIESPIKASSL